MQSPQRLALCIALIATIGAPMAAPRAMAQSPGPANVGSPAPDFRAYTLRQPREARTWNDYRGSVVIISIWATWCGSCREELRSMQRLYEEVGARGLRVVAVSVDSGPDDQIEAFARSAGLTFDMLRDENRAILKAFRARGVPASFLIGRDGIVKRRVLSGVPWDTGSPRDQVIALLQ